MESVFDKFRVVDIRTISTNEYGALSFFQSDDSFEFDFKRIYYIYGAKKGVVRGKHAHKALQQIMFCPYGSIKIILDDGQNIFTFQLSNPKTGLIIGPSVWREMIWEKDDSVLCVVASKEYDEGDYIRSYDDFIKYVGRNSDES